ncbi:DUF2303 family protein [Rhodanobacter sp. BL-MT-08]
MDKSAIDAIGQLAVEAAKANQLDTDTPVIVLKDDDDTQKVVSLEPFQHGRSRYRGSYRTLHLKPFANYVNAVKENNSPAAQAQGFIDTTLMSAKVFFNLGDAETPGHGDYTATLDLKPTAAYAALTHVTNKNTILNQRQLHDFVEDWRDHITFLIDGQPSEAPLANALAAIRDISITTAREVNNVERDMGNTRSAMESVDASSKLKLPSGFTFRAHPYEGLPLRTFTLRLGVNTGGDKIALVLRIQQAEQVVEDIANDFHDELTKLLGTSSTLNLGAFTP